MSYVDTMTEVTAGMAVPAMSRMPAGRTEVVANTLQCLVVSTDQSRREMFVRSVDAGGWDAVVCTDTVSAFSAIRREAFQLALIDMESLGGDDATELKEVVQQASELPNVLVMVCGNEGDGLEEVWARQLGVWLYLPGVTEGCDIASLCDQARPVADRNTETVTSQVA